MRLWQLASVAFFVYVMVLSATRSGAHRAARKALVAGTGGLLATWASSATDSRLLTEWIWPPALLLIAYWSSGLLFIAPRAGQEAALQSLDDRLHVRDFATRTPRALAEILEIAYAGVYLLIPLALAAHLAFAVSPDPDWFWSVVLITDFVCFAALPWIQTRPPRALEARAPWHASFRRFNVRMLGATSIQANTFPSGHAAEALVAALLVAGAPIGIVVVMSAAALAVSAGAGLGRYHFLADALAGWAVAIAVFLLVGLTVP